MADNNELFSSIEIDAIGELMNISLGSSATAVSNMLERRVNITTPTVKITTKDEFEFSNLEPALFVEITYVAGLDGSNIMLLRRDDVRKILEILMFTEIDPDDFELDELSTSAICEVMNQMMGSAATTMSELIGEKVDISTPVAAEIDDPASFKNEHFSGSEPMIIVSFHLDIENCLNSEFMTIMSENLVRRMLASSGLFDENMDTETPQNEEPPVQAAVQNVAPVQTPSAPEPTVNVQQNYAPPQPQLINVQNMENRFDNITKLSKSEEGNLDLIMTVPLQLSVEIGRAEKQVKEILTLSQGSLIVLDKLAGEQVDVFVNGQNVAKGDVVVIEDNFGVRVTEIIKNPEFLLKG